MRRKLLSLLLTVVMVLGMFPTTAFAASEYTQADIINGVWLTWDTIADDNTLQNEVISDLTLVSADDDAYASVYWISNDTSVITVDGTVTRPDYDENDVEVTLTAVIQQGTSWESLTGNSEFDYGTKDFTVTVLADTETTPAVDCKTVTFKLPTQVASLKVDTDKTDDETWITVDTTQTYDLEASTTFDFKATLTAGGEVTGTFKTNNFNSGALAFLCNAQTVQLYYTTISANED